ncbi:exported hypothetical protein [uncultured Desulfovibrio sp.]|uniref:Uncharacterized protein n=1 Tax=uncultured Desulfovibrio sp. TaxID=167968 RepID=A0A212J243_9BACT|nr:exported hypothetical protein [uncultured Desulfovibrio sp.]
MGLLQIWARCVCCALAAPAGFGLTGAVAFVADGQPLSVLRRARLCWSARPLEKESANG